MFEKIKDSNKIILTLVIIVFSSCIVHELGHIFVALLYGYKLTEYGITMAYVLPSLYVKFGIPNPSRIVLLSGGFLQATYLMLFVRKYPGIEYGASICLIYAVLEIFMFGG